MPFFDPLPPEPPEVAREWGPPAWERPSEGTLPALLPVNEIVLRTESAVVEVEFLRVYPNGFTIHLRALADPHLGREHSYRVLGIGGGPDQGERQPRVGVCFADGRTAGREAAWHGPPIDKDSEGIPTGPILRMVGGGGGSGGYHFSFWVYPLPPTGPLKIYATLPAVDDVEAEIVLDGDAIRTASARARVIWA